jgi:hypothetical protein
VDEKIHRYFADPLLEHFVLRAEPGGPAVFLPSKKHRTVTVEFEYELDLKSFLGVSHGLRLIVASVLSDDKIAGADQ